MARHSWKLIGKPKINSKTWTDRCVLGCGWRRKSVYRKFGPRMGLEYFYLRKGESLGRAPSCVPLIAPIRVVCETPGCSCRGKNVNVITGFKKESDRITMLEQWADAHEKADVCKRCGVLGVPVE